MSTTGVAPDRVGCAGTSWHRRACVMTAPWDEFVHAHGEIIGYDLGGAFIPVKAGDGRAIRIYDEVTARFPGYAGVPVYGPKAGASVDES